MHYAKPSFEGRSAHDVRERRVGVYARGGKTVCDLFLVLISLPISIPLILLLAAIVAMDGSNPFYFQVRVGRAGKRFRILKLRTMVPDADSLLDRHLKVDPDAASEWQTNQKLRQDPRVTRFGRFLRKTSLDEFPQIWNVLRGEMSLVGPRPMLPSQEDLYPGVAYYNMRPGITGPWQISVRNEAEFASRARFDTMYWEEVSFLRDALILARTSVVVVNGTGC